MCALLFSRTLICLFRLLPATWIRCAYNHFHTHIYFILKHPHICLSHAYVNFDNNKWQRFTHTHTRSHIHICAPCVYRFLFVFFAGKWLLSWLTCRCSIPLVFGTPLATSPHAAASRLYALILMVCNFIANIIFEKCHTFVRVNARVL